MAVYAVSAVCWMVLGFMFAAISAADGSSAGSTLVALLAPAIGLLFNATGLARPKRISLDASGLRYRPVWGRSRSVAWGSFAAFDIFVVNALGSGFVIYRQSQPLGWRGLGFFLEPATLLRWIAKAYVEHCNAPDMKIFKGWVPNPDRVA